MELTKLSVAGTQTSLPILVFWLDKVTYLQNEFSLVL